MDLQLFNKGLDFAKRRKKWVLLLAMFGASGYGAFKLYNLPSFTRKRRKLMKLLRVLFTVGEAVSDCAETIGILSNDLKKFLMYDSDEIPKSLKQIAKIARCDEFSDSVTRVSEALTVGISRGYRRDSSDQSEVAENGNFVDRVVDRIMSTAGTGFASVVAGSFARNLVLGFYSDVASVGGSNGSSRVASVLSDGAEFSRMSKWVDVMCEDRCKELIGSCIRVFVSTAVAAYLEKTLDINVYDEVFAGLTNPNHESKVRDLTVTVCNAAVETFVKTSHHVLTSKNTEPDPSSCSYAGNCGKCLKLNGDAAALATHLSGKQLSDKFHNGGWGSMVLSTLSVPRNRRFAFDVTGRVTFDTFRSVMEFLWCNLSDGLRTSSNVVHDHVVDKGRRVVRYFGLKSFLVVAICLVICSHIIFGTRALLPA